METQKLLDLRPSTHPRSARLPAYSDPSGLAAVWLSILVLITRHILHRSKVIGTYRALDLANSSLTGFRIILNSPFSSKQSALCGTECFENNLIV